MVLCDGLFVALYGRSWNMKRSLISMSLLVAAVTVVLAGTDAEARCCRNRCRGGWGYQNAGYTTQSTGYVNQTACCQGNGAYQTTGANGGVYTNSSNANAPAPPAEPAPTPTDGGTAPRPAT